MPIDALPPPCHLPLAHGHQMAWFSVGDEQATPLVVLHGGPGGRSRAASLNWFDGLALRCIAYDQRGCGQSTPAGECAHNTLADLVADIERLREHLGLCRWGVVGGSWGSLLAVAYAAAHPERVSGLFLRSSFLGGVDEVDAFFEPWARWLGSSGAARLGWLPALVATAAASGADGLPVPDPVHWLQTDSGAVAADRIALAWQAFEQAQSTPGGLKASPELRWSMPAADAAVPPFPSGLRVQQHYLRHGCFTDEPQRNGWLARLDTALIDRPVALVHGLADVVCAPAVSRALAARWPHAQCRWVDGAGHDMDHPALRAALVDASGRWAEQLERS